MSKPIQETIFKSRLTITYRTNISGTVEEGKLPYRLLVLGEFSGKALREGGMLEELHERPIHTIKRGTTVDDHLSEMVPVWRVPNTEEFKALRSTLPGEVTFDKVVCSIPKTAIERNESKKYALSGTATFRSTMEQNGLCDIEGSVDVGGTLAVKITNGECEAGEAEPMLFGALQGSQVDLATGKIKGLVTLHLEVPQKIAAADLKMAPVEEDDVPNEANKVKATQFALTVAKKATVKAERTVPLSSLASFTPDALAQSIPELRRLQVVKQLLLEAHSQLRNRSELRRQLKGVFPAYGDKKEVAEQKLAPVAELKQWAAKAYPLLSLERQIPQPDDANKPKPPVS